MPHFSKDALEARPDTLDTLREILHGRQQGGRVGRARPATPTKEDRFGLPASGREAPIRKRRSSALAGS